MTDTALNVMALARVVVLKTNAEGGPVFVVVRVVAVGSGVVEV